MVELLTSQSESDAAFHVWADALISGSAPSGNGWMIEGKGVYFTNYGHGEPGTIATQVMLGADPAFGTGVVKIVQPETAQRDRGKKTAFGVTENGRLLLLRQGRLQPNALSRGIREDFSALSGLTSTPVTVAGSVSKYEWFVVADLGSSPVQIVEQTADFALACAKARSVAGGGKSKPGLPPGTLPSYSLGSDEKGSVTTVEFPARSADVVRLQGYVWEALKSAVGDKLTKPMSKGFAVDGYLADPNILIEIKTGTSPHDIYEAVGQLVLYPGMIGFAADPSRILLVPSDTPISPLIAAALNSASVEIFSYHVEPGEPQPIITFPKQFIARCLS